MSALLRFRLNAAALRALADDGATPQPKWQMIFPLGTHHNGGWPKEGVKVDAAFCKSMVANWKKLGEPELVVDYFHKTNDEAAPNDERIAAGWMTALEVRADGLWSLIRWTEKARSRILADELRALSPEFATNGMDPHTGKPQGPTLICCALLTNPAFKEMPRVAAAAVQPAAPEEQVMNREQINAMLKLAGITLAATATDAEASAALSKHLEAEAALRATAAAEVATLKAKQEADAAAVLKAKNEADATTKSLKAELDAKSTELLKVEARVAQIEKNATDAGINSLLARAKAEGRITAAGAEKNVRAFAEKMGLAAASEFVDSFPKNTVAPVGPALGHGGAGSAAELVDLKALAAEYGAALDVAIKGGAKTVEASKVLNRDPKFAALFTKTAINARPSDAN